jgi:uncharacterized protein YndB with AHSA1/START domain
VDEEGYAMAGSTYELAVERVIGAAPEVVFRGFLEMHDERPDWILESHLDLRVDGTWTVVFHPPGLQVFREERVFSEVDPPHRLTYAMTAIFDGAPNLETSMEMTFDAQGAGTRMSLVQRGFPTPEIRDEFAGGWRDVLELLDHRISEQSTR